MADDSDSDDSLLAFNPNADDTTSNKRERVKTKRYMDEMVVGEVDEFDLTKLAAESEKSTKKFQKMGFESRIDALNSNKNSDIDWEYINKKKEPTTTKEEDNGENGFLLDDILGGGDFDIEDGDYDGKMKNIYQGGRIILCKQSAIWPELSNLIFDVKKAKLMDKGCEDVYVVYDLLEKLTHLSLEDSAQNLTELLLRDKNSLHALFEAAATDMNGYAMNSAESPIVNRNHHPSSEISDESASVALGGGDKDVPTNRSILIPQVFWSWLMDMVTFHPIESVAKAAATTMTKFIQVMPAPQPTNNHRTTNGVWDPSRPLNFRIVCRVLFAFGLDPLAEDPSLTSLTSNADETMAKEGKDQEGKENCSLGLGSKFVATSPYLYPPMALSRTLEIWEKCFEKSLFQFSVKDLICFIQCLMVLSVDVIALGTPGLLYHRDKLLASMLRCFDFNQQQDNKGTFCDKKRYDLLLNKMKTLVNQAQDDEVKLLLVRSIPVINTNDIGKRLKSELAIYIAQCCFPQQHLTSSSTLIPLSGNNYRDDAFMCVQKFFQHYSIDKPIRALYQQEGVGRLNCLISLIDLLLISAAPPFEFSVDELTDKMVKVLQIANGIVRMTPDPAQLNFKLLLQSLLDKYSPISEALKHKDKPKNKQQSTISFSVSSGN